MHPTAQTNSCCVQNSNSHLNNMFIPVEQKLWRLGEPEVQDEHQNLIAKCYEENITGSCVEDAWQNFKERLVTGMDHIAKQKVFKY